MTRGIPAMPSKLASLVRNRRGFCALGALAIALSIAVPGSAAFPINGSPLFVYSSGLNGTTSPPSAGDAAALNASLYGTTAPAAGQFLSSASPYDGTLTDLTAAGNQPSGMIVLPCTNFTYSNTAGCIATSTSTAANPVTPIAVQSWPFYVGAGASSNVNPGPFTLESNTDDGSWLVVAPATFTYAQPANFGPVTGLTAGTSVVSTASLQSPTSTTGTFRVKAPNACTTAQHLFGMTFEYIEAVGGQAQMEYSWQPPGSGAFGLPTQSVVWGQVFSNGVALSGATVVVPSGGTLTSDASGCFGYNFAPSWSGTKSLGTATATNTAANGGQSLSQAGITATMGQSTQLAFNFLPALNLVKSHAGTFVDGTTATYSLVVDNTKGTAPTVSPVKIVDTLPAGLTYDAALTTGTNWSCSAAGQVVTCTYSGTALSPGNVAAATAPALTLGVNVVGPAGNVTNSAVASVASKDTAGSAITITSNTATDPTTLVDPATVTKTVQNLTSGEANAGTNDTGKPGDVLQYVLVFTNVSSNALKNVTLSDPVPATATYVTGSAACVSIPAGATCAPGFAAGTVSWTFGGTVAAGASATVRFQASIK